MFSLCNYFPSKSVNDVSHNDSCYLIRFEPFTNCGPSSWLVEVAGRQILALLYTLCFICEAVQSSGWLSPRRAPSLWPLADLYSTPTLPTSTSLFPSPLITTEGSICREAEFIPFVPPLFAFISWAGDSISQWIFIEWPARSTVARLDLVR